MQSKNSNLASRRACLRFCHTLFLFLALILEMQGIAIAATPVLGDSQLAFQWLLVPGRAKEIAINANGDVVALDSDGHVWERGKTFQDTWGMAGGKFERITLTPRGNLWAIDAERKIFRYTGTWWKSIPGEAIDIASAGDDKHTHVAIVTPHGVPMLWDNRTQNWKHFESTGIIPEPAQIIAIDSTGAPWVVTAQGNIWRLVDKGWIKHPGIATDIAIGPEGGVYITGRNRHLYQWDQKQQDWISIANVEKATLVAVGPKDKPWFVNEDGSIFASDLFEEKEKQKEAKAAPPSPPDKRRPLSTGTFTSSEPFNFVKVNGFAYELAIGGDGSVFVSGPEGQVLRWSDINKAFVKFPGVLSRIAVDREGNPWGLSSGEIYRFDGTRWTLIAGNAVDIAIGFDGTVMITDADESVYRYDQQLNRFIRLPQGVKGTRIAIDPQGNPWTIRKDESIYRCNLESSCIKTPLKGTSIAIGPDNSVFMTSADQLLYRWNATRETWDRIDTTIKTISVAVGPSGRPWVIDKNGAIYASRFFARDELNDAAEVVIASAKTSSSPVSTFTFTKSMLFQKVSTPYIPGIDIKIGADGILYNYDDATCSQLYRYNTYFNKWYLNPVQPTPFGLHAVAETNGRLWVKESNAGCLIGLQCKRQEAPGSTNFVEPTLDGATQSSCTDISIGADNSVFVIANPGGFFSYLYRYDNKKAEFTLFSDLRFSNGQPLREVAVDPNGNPWVITSDDKIWRHDGKKFVQVPGIGKVPPKDVYEMAIGPNGSVYVIAATPGSNRLYKWNATNHSFDQILGGPKDLMRDIAVDSQGRPWITVFAPRAIWKAQ